jgi:hypothetical protein
MKTYNLNDRPFGGSQDPRLAPEIVNRQLNAKLGPRVPKVKETSTGALNIGDSAGRRKAIGLTSRLSKD